MASLFQGLPPMPEQQVQFCAAFRELETWHKAYEDRVNAVGDNPIQLAQMKNEKPDFARLFGARSFAVMGDGAFQNWVGHLILIVGHDPGSGRDSAYVAFQFPCVWYSYDGILVERQRHENLFVGNGFDSKVLRGFAAAPVYRQGVSIDSPSGKALARLTQGEAVTLSGKLSCEPPAGYKKGGCESANAVQPDAIVATISSVTSVKTDVTARLAEDPPIVTDFDRVNALRQRQLTFSISDTRQALKEKTRALVWRNPKPASADLLEYVFSPERCPGCVEANTFGGIDLDGYDLDPSGKTVRRQRPCSMEKAQNAFCMDEIVAFVEGDIPAVRGVGTIKTSPYYVPGPNGLCYLVSPEDQFALLHRTEKINDFLQPLGLRMESNGASRKTANPCDSLNNKVTAERTEIGISREHRDTSLTAVSVTIAAGEFRSKLAEAVKTRAMRLGADPAQYEAAMETVNNVVRVCSSISEAEFAESMDEYNQPHLLRYKNGKYKECIPTGIFRTIPETKDQPGLAIRHDITENWDPVQKRWSSVKFRITVFLKALPDYKPATSSGSVILNEYEAQYIALDAHILNSGATAAPRFICPGAQLKQNWTGNREVIASITAPTRITRLDNAGRGTVVIQLEGLGSNSYTIPATMVKDSCAGFTTTSEPGTPVSGLRTPEANEHNIKVTPSSPIVERDATIVAPGRGNHNYNIYYIDTTAFAAGGTLELQIQIDRNSSTDASFDLFPANVSIPTSGGPTSAIQGRHDVRRGGSTLLSYPFPVGKIVVLGMEGNWFSPKGATGRVHFRATVRKR